MQAQHVHMLDKKKAYFVLLLERAFLEFIFV